jgi:hypothetical protein
MKLEIARGLFLCMALGVASLAAAAWHEPAPRVLSGLPSLAKNCPMPANLRAKVQPQPDEDLLLLLFGLAQGMRPQG